MKKDEYRIWAPVYGVTVDPLVWMIRRQARRLLSCGEDNRVLDVGCGTGAFLKSLSAEKCRLTGIDASRAMLSRAGKRLKGKGALCSGDVPALPFADESFDIVSAQLFVHELDPSVRERALAEMARVMDNDGVMMLVDYSLRPARRPWRWPAAAIILIFELLAGRRHSRACFSFLRAGGMEPLLHNAGLHPVGSRTMRIAPVAVWVVRKKSRELR